ncbi:MAG TPA: DUF4350 domain-containing protein [Acidimicrobiales bacterium]|nr:DUF4350 domain-containing protein [Acidimicrobiales bacterium]
MTPARRALPFVLLAVAVLLIGVVTRSGRSEGKPLDPRSTGPLGARALVLLLGRFDADVLLIGGVPPKGAVAVLLQDQLNENETVALEGWVRDGGTLVVTDPLSSFAPTVGGSSVDLFDPATEDRDLLRPRCALEAVSRVGRIRVSGAAPFRPRAGQIGCFPLQGGSYLLARAEGEGTVVALGGAGPFVNEQLDEEDNAVLAVSLMAPTPGTVVDIVQPSVVGGGRKSLRQLVPRRVKDGLWELLIAFGLFALWRARRLGKPVLEPQPVQIAGSELVVAVGNLLHHGRRREPAAAMLRSSLRRTLSEGLGVPADAPSDVLAAAASARAGVDPATVEAALDERPPLDDAALVRLAQSVESLRNEVIHAR